MNPFRLTGRAFRDWYDNVVPLFLWSVVWWILLPTVLLAPPATLLLFRIADQRHGTLSDRPNLVEGGRLLLAWFVRGWLFALATVPVVAIAAFNLIYYGGSSGIISVLAPIWLMLLLVSLAWMLIVFSAGGLEGAASGETLRASGRLLLYRLPQALVVLFLAVLLPLVLTLGVAPIFFPLTLIVPGIAATSFNRFVLTGLRIEIPNPYAPTPERQHEERGAVKSGRRWGRSG